MDGGLWRGSYLHTILFGGIHGQVPPRWPLLIVALGGAGAVQWAMALWLAAPLDRNSNDGRWTHPEGNTFFLANNCRLSDTRIDK